MWDPRTLVPFDHDGLRACLHRTGRLVIAHEGAQRGGVGAEVAAWAAEHCQDLLTAPVRRIAARNTPVPYAPVLEQEVIPDAGRIADEIRTLVA